MFTGLVEEVGRVARLERRPDGARVTVQARKVLEGTALGDSIAVNGACLTVVALGSDWFTVDAMPETLAHSTLGQAKPGTAVNLERSLALGGRLGGHLVLGHVDAVADVLSVTREGIAWRVRIELPAEVRGCVAPKGSIAVDGISLTVIDVDDESFSLGVIPHTLRETTLGGVKAGQQVNLEADVLARYVLRTLQALGRAGDGRRDGAPASGAGDRGATGGGLTEDFLREQGFA